MDINTFMHYILIIAILFIGIFIYFKIADRYKIINKPNYRSSHNYITIRGGGIIFWLAGVLCSLRFLPESIYFLVGLSLISAVSFWDDFSSLPNKVRAIVHFLSVSLIFYSLGIFSLLPCWLSITGCVFFVGILNAYNFMDGINGMTGLYSLSILTSLQYLNNKKQFVESEFITYGILACFVFLIFNYRKKARCFAGDVGSMAISFWIVTLLLQLIINTHSIIWILFLAVYGVDTICTILHRLYLRQNIFKAHRLHFYQILSNEQKISHLIVSALYAFLQLIINVFVIFHADWKLTGYLVLIPLISIYTLKFRLLKQK